MLKSWRTILSSLILPSNILSNNIVSIKLSSYILSPRDFMVPPLKIYIVCGG